MDIKQISIRGDAATAFMGSTRRNVTAKKKQQGGFNSAPGPAIPFGPSNMASARKIMSSANAFHTGGAGVENVVPSNSNRASPSIPVVPSNSAASSNSTQPVVVPAANLPPTSQEGGAKKKALILAPSRKSKSKVHLAPPANGKRSSKSGTRKIRVQLSCMKKRLTRAKTIKSESKQKPIAEVRRILEEAKLVKPRADGKEVPESVLRDIYSDYMLLRNRVL
jgi:hypothetical protein